ncbi:MAG TPA: protein kinase, partial [Planctomycetota bacterium]|nr:protein kinase [Planctomycetota bacterium]
HAKGIVHRDVKPTNILVEASGRPVLMDFGIARSGGISSTLSANGMVLGTPGYMAPEQLAGELDQIGAPADIYALGVLLYEILAGRRPFDGRTVVELAERIRQGRPPAPRSIRPDVPPALEAACLKAMALLPDQRHATAYAFAEELENWLSGRSSPSAPRGRRRWALAAAAVGVLAVVGISLWWVLPSAPTTPTQSRPVHGVDPGREELARAQALLKQRPAEAAARWADHIRAEAHLRKAAALSPRLVDAPLELGRLYAERGRFDAAHEALDRVLQLDPTHAEAKKAKGEIVVTEQVLLHIDRLHFPELTKSLQERLAARAKGLDPFAAAVARADWDAARSAAPLGTRMTVEFLSGRRRPLLSALLGRADEVPPGEPGVWAVLIRGHERRAMASPVRMDLASAHPLHAGILRLAAALEPEEDKALALLARALQSNPDYLQARLARHRLSPGDPEEILRLARRWRVNALALKEIDGLLRSP